MYSSFMRIRQPNSSSSQIESKQSTCIQKPNPTHPVPLPGLASVHFTPFTDFNVSVFPFLSWYHIAFDVRVNRAKMILADLVPRRWLALLWCNAGVNCAVFILSDMVPSWLTSRLGLYTRVHGTVFILADDMPG